MDLPAQGKVKCCFRCPQGAGPSVGPHEPTRALRVPKGGAHWCYSEDVAEHHYPADLRRRTLADERGWLGGFFQAGPAGSIPVTRSTVETLPSRGSAYSTTQSLLEVVTLRAPERPLLTLRYSTGPPRPGPRVG